MRCYHCGAELVDGAKYCGKCGKSQEFTEELIQAAKDGNQDAISELYNRTYNNVYLEAKALIADEDTVLDIVQDSYLKAFRNLHQLKDATKFRAWIKRIAHNRAIDYLRKTKPVVFTDMVSADSEEILDFEDTRSENLPDVVIEEKERRELLREMLNSLPPEQRTVVIMHTLNQMPFNAIAEELGINENTVKSRFNYGTKKLNAKAKEMEKKGYKLYSITGLSLLLLLLKKEEAYAAEMPKQAMEEQILQQLTQQNPSTATNADKLSEAGKRVAENISSKAAKTAASTAGKGAVTKIIAGVVAVAVIGGGVVFGVHQMNKNKQPEVVAVEETPAEEAEVEMLDNVLAERQEAAVASYAAVVNKYVTALEDSNFSVESYSDMATNLLNYYHMYHNSDFYYAYYDVDGNGVDELVIGNRPKDYDSYSLVDLYTFDGNGAVRAIANDTFGDRSSLTILSDGTFCETASGGADDTTSIYYQLSEDGYSTLVALESSASEVTDFNWIKINVSTVEDTPAEVIDFDFTGYYGSQYAQLTITKEGDNYHGVWSDEYYTREATLTPTGDGKLQAAVYDGDEIITIEPMADGVAGLIITGNDAYQDTKIYVRFDGEFYKTGSITESYGDISHFLGDFVYHTEINDVVLNLYMNGDILEMYFGDDTVMGYGTYPFETYSIDGDTLVATDGYGVTHYFTRTQDGGIYLDTNGIYPEREGNFDIK